MVLTRSQAAALKVELVPFRDNPEAFAKKLKAEAEVKRQYDAALAAELDNLANIFANSVSLGQSPEQALVDAFGKLGVGGRRRKTRKGKKSKRKTRRH